MVGCVKNMSTRRQHEHPIVLLLFSNRKRHQCCIIIATVPLGTTVFGVKITVLWCLSSVITTFKITKTSSTQKMLCALDVPICFLKQMLSPHRRLLETNQITFLQPNSVSKSLISSACVESSRASSNDLAASFCRLFRRYAKQPRRVNSPKQRVIGKALRKPFSRRIS